MRRDRAEEKTEEKGYRSRFVRLWEEFRNLEFRGVLFREVRIDRSEGGKLVGRRGDDDVAVNAEKGRGNAPSPLPPFALRPSSASSLLHRLSLSLSLPDTAFPRINNSAQRNTSRKTLFNLDERERVYITAAGAYPFSTRAPRELRSR